MLQCLKVHMSLGLLSDCKNATHLVNNKATQKYLYIIFKLLCNGMKCMLPRAADVK